MKLQIFDIEVHDGINVSFVYFDENDEPTSDLLSKRTLKSFFESQEDMVDENCNTDKIFETIWQDYLLLEDLILDYLKFES